MKINVIRETPEEREIRIRTQTKKRIAILASVCIVCVLARILIPKPPPPKAPDHTDKPFKALPGLLEKIPEATKAKMDPKIIAQLKKADEEAAKIKQGNIPDAIANKPYIPPELPAENLEDKEKMKEIIYQYAKRQRIREITQEAEAASSSKTMLVLFKRGGHVKAEKANTTPSYVSIEIDRNMAVQVPTNLVKSVTANAATWEEPVPRGEKRLKPAKGITIQVSAATAKRITVKKRIIDES